MEDKINALNKLIDILVEISEDKEETNLNKEDNDKIQKFES